MAQCLQLLQQQQQQQNCYPYSFDSPSHPSRRRWNHVIYVTIYTHAYITHLHRMCAEWKAERQNATLQFTNDIQRFV